MTNLNFVILMETGQLVMSIGLLLIVSIAFFLLVREILCWYWKINQSISIQQDILNALETQNTILKKTLEYQTNQQQSTSTKIETEKKNIDTNKEEIIKFSEKEEIEIAKFLKFGLKTGERLVIHKQTRKIDRFNEEEWNKILKKFEQDEWFIIEEK